MIKKIGLILAISFGGAIIGAIIGSGLTKLGLIYSLLAGLFLGIIVSLVFASFVQVKRWQYIVLYGWIVPLVLLCTFAYFWFMTYLFAQSTLGAEMFGAITGALVALVLSVSNIKKRLKER